MSSVGNMPEMCMMAPGKLITKKVVEYLNKIQKVPEKW